ncbi:MAG: type VI secretion system baseplate subunit TssE [Salinisphaeraceae bacterium]|jgi:type VI secretion system protein ImpF|nr:type VI secretion system baseplate subunit TssE [Salinisphaeraceae bacterium]
MHGPTSSFLDRLISPDTAGHTRSSDSPLRRLEHLKRSVACDLENLLNTRLALRSEVLEDYPECRQSVINYGLRDFSWMSLTSSPDRNRICRALEAAVSIHEPRLAAVEALLETDRTTPNRLHFCISALLVVPPLSESVSFDALFEPARMAYSVTRSESRAA